MTSLQLVWAAAPVSRPSKTGWEFPIFWASLPLIGALLIGALIVYLVGRWRQKNTRLSPPPNAQLAHFRALYDRGEMSREEFERVRGLLGEQIREEMNLPVAPTPPPAAPPPNGTTNGKPLD